MHDPVNVVHLTQEDFRYYKALELEVAQLKYRVQETKRSRDRFSETLCWTLQQSYVPEDVKKSINKVLSDDDC